MSFLTQLRIGPRLALAFGVLVAVLIILAGITFQQLESINGDNDRIRELQRRATLAGDWSGLVELNASRALGVARSNGDAAVDALYAQPMKATSEQITKLQEELTGLIDSDQGRALLAAIGAQRKTYVDSRAEVLAKIRNGDLDAAQRQIDSQMLPAAGAYGTSIGNLVNYQQERVAAGLATLQTSVRNAEFLVVLLSLFGAALAATFGWLITRSITQPLALTVQATDRVAQGDLTYSISPSGRDEMSDLLRSLSRMQDSLRKMVGEVRVGSDSIGTASVQIATGNQDLSGRTEQTASKLQQAAASLEQLTGTVGQTADSARTANQLAASASESARRGGSVVADVVSTMDEITTSSKKIADIIGTIDGIAFQTNILALNAAVEAARAGEQGRGFAVVAGEVRTLAQRSAEAAKQIKSLIQASVERVETGSRLVQDAGSAMGEIVGGVQRVTDVIGEISAATSEQSAGLRQVNEAVAQLDQMTQQNAALVEESAAAAESMADQSRRLTEVVRSFKLHQDHNAAAPAARTPSPAASPRAAASAVIRQVSQSATQARGKPLSKPLTKPAGTAGKSTTPSDPVDGARAPVPASRPEPGTAAAKPTAPVAKAATASPVSAAAAASDEWETF
jgi:methyl-accepting chemotaxis protein